MIEKLAQDLIENKADDFVVRMCQICGSARGIESNCKSNCGPSESDNKKVKESDNKIVKPYMSENKAVKSDELDNRTVESDESDNKTLESKS